jgi:hypothetical protein
MVIGTTRLPAQHCPNCRHKLDAATPATKDLIIPKPNDYTICIECQQILQFDADMILHKRRFEEVDEKCKADIAKAITIMRIYGPTWKAMQKARRN